MIPDSLTGNTTRDQIIQAAIHLFAVKGYAQTGMEEIAKEVGISKPAIYYHFESKEKLFEALLQRVDEFHSGVFAELARMNLSLPDLIEELIRRTIHEIRELPDWIRMFHRLLSAGSELPAFVDMKVHHKQDHETFRRLLAPALRDRRLREGLSEEQFVDYVLTVIIGSMAHWYAMDELPDEEETPKLIRDSLMFGVIEKEEGRA